MTVEQILRDVWAGKDGARRHLVLEWRGPLEIYFRGRRIPEHDVQDLTNSTLEIIMRDLPHQPERDQWSSWVYGVARNLAVGQYRTDLRKAAIEAECAQLADIPATGWSTKVRREKDDQAFEIVRGELSGFRRRQIEHDLNGADPRELSEMEGIAMATVRTRRARLRRWFQARYEVVRGSLD